MRSGIKKIPVQPSPERLASATSPEGLPLLPACHSDHYIIQAARVIEQRSSQLLVQAQLPSQCASCEKQAGCALGLLGRWAARRPQQLSVFSQAAIAPNTWIWIGLPKQAFVYYLLSLYLLPLLCVLIGGAFGGWFLPFQWSPDLQTGFGMVLGGGLGALWARWRVQRFLQRARPASKVVVLWPNADSDHLK